MIYGLYLSASGVMTSSYRQDVIANNIANSETVGFKRDLAMFQERRTELQDSGLAPSHSNKMLEALGGGVLAAPTAIDHSQGILDRTGSNLDLAIRGEGYLKVGNGDQVNLTRDGRMVVNSKNHLAMAINPDAELLDAKGKPIVVDSRIPPEVDKQGNVRQNNEVVGQLALVDAPDPTQLTKSGGTLLKYSDMTKLRPAGNSTIESGYRELSNVEPSAELSGLMDAQRQLEANANMIRYQDSMLAKVCNDVGKIT
jgi:flagellar basal-body rod protein FlgF